MTASRTEFFTGKGVQAIGVINRHHANIFFLIMENNLQRIMKDSENLKMFLDILTALQFNMKHICPVSTMKNFDSFLFKVWKKYTSSLRRRKGKRSKSSSRVKKIKSQMFKLAKLLLGIRQSYNLSFGLSFEILLSIIENLDLLRSVGEESEAGVSQLISKWIDLFIRDENEQDHLVSMLAKRYRSILDGGFDLQLKVSLRGLVWSRLTLNSQKWA